MVSCMLAISWECFCALCFFVFFSFAWSVADWLFHGSVSVLAVFFLKLPWSVAVWLFHGNASVAFVLFYSLAFHGHGPGSMSND